MMFSSVLYVSLLVSCFAAQLPLDTTKPRLPKVAIIGNSGAGKTCLFRALRREYFALDVPATICNDLEILSLLSQRHGAIVKVALWDTAGQERYRAIAVQHLRNSVIILAVFDVTDVKHMDELLQDWGEELSEYSRNGAKVILVGAKYDIVVDSRLSICYLNEEDVHLCALERGFAAGFVVSSKDSVNIGRLKDKIAEYAGDWLVLQSKPIEPQCQSQPINEDSCCTLI